MRIPAFVAGTFAVLLLSALSVAPAWAASAPSTPAPAKKAVTSRVEQRIKSLHDQLKITVEEEPQWAAVAQAMRDDAQAVDALIRERHEKAGKMNAVDDLRSYQAIAEAHAAGITKLVSAFQPLYSAMSPDQQKNADAVFAKTMRRHPAKKKAK